MGLGGKRLCRRYRNLNKKKTSPSWAMTQRFKPFASSVLPLPRIHTARGRFGEARSVPQHHGHAHWLANKRCWRACEFLHCSPDRVVPARPAALKPRGAASSRPRGSCWAGSRPPEVTRPASGAVAGCAKKSPETCSVRAHDQCNRSIAWVSVETTVPKGHLDGG